jgi:endoglucanase
LINNDIDFAYWPLVGFLENNAGNGWALLNWDRNTGARNGILDGQDWRQSDWTHLINATSSTQHPGPATRWRMLNVDHEDYVKSATMLTRGDWDNGARKAACPDGLRLIGVARNARGLCTDSTYGNLWGSAKAFETVNDERHVSSDWASGYTKLQCADGSFAIGYAVRGAKTSSILCAQSDSSLKTSGRTLWFDKGDNRADGTLGGDWANGTYKGQCGHDEYLAGIAFTTSFLNSGNPAAILCRK